jgi:hypothetical protein
MGHASSPTKTDGSTGAVDNDNTTEEVLHLEAINKSSHFSNRTDALTSLEQIYSGHARHPHWKIGNDYHAAVSEIKGVKDLPKDAVLYDEITPAALMQLLGHIDARPGQNFVDFGSGTGKTVFAAWLLGLNASGVELVRGRWKIACKIAQTAHHLGYHMTEQGPGVSFIHDDFRHYDLSNADIVFINSARFSKGMMRMIADNATAQMRPGAKIISSGGLPGETFRKDESVFAATSSALLAGKWVIQTVKGHAVVLTDTKATEKPTHARISIHGQPASLMRTEAKPAKHGPEQGPVFGAMPHHEADASDLELSDTNVCSLASLAPAKQEVLIKKKEAPKKVTQMKEASNLFDGIVDTEVF